MTQPTTHTHTPQSQTPLEQQVADLQHQVQQLMTLVKGKQEAVTPRERADFLAAQTALAERVTLAESKVNKSLDLAQRALDAANSALNTLPQCVSVELATNLQTQINSAVTGINDLNGRVADVKTQLDTRPPTDNPATMPVDVEDLANLRSALDDRIDHSARTTEDIRSTLNARIDTEAARIAQLTKSVDDLERKSALFLNFTAQPSLDVDATNSRIAEALSSADTANVTANSAYGLANTANQTVEHMRTRFDNIDTALANTTHDFNYVWSHIALLLDKSFPAWRGVTYARPMPMAFTEPSVTLEPTLYHMRVVLNPPTAAAMTEPAAL
jgi:chromosome segregation ATPase